MYERIHLSVEFSEEQTFMFYILINGLNNLALFYIYYNWTVHDLVLSSFV
jgi:hypothetical protein